ncbi:hypothetical protein HD806DRAFT_276382 [Xylariaceae sp. AK1471]|nr:hypothetical protein HD806DRAFT_276382 [Xylariaceae sp. AK1471]
MTCTVDSAGATQTTDERRPSLVYSMGACTVIGRSEAFGKAGPCLAHSRQPVQLSLVSLAIVGQMTDQFRCCKVGAVEKCPASSWAFGNSRSRPTRVPMHKLGNKYNHLLLYGHSKPLRSLLGGNMPSYAVETGPPGLATAKIFAPHIDATPFRSTIWTPGT